jgi:hypothetical protein
LQKWRSRVPLTFDICDLPFDLFFRFATFAYFAPLRETGLFAHELIHTFSAFSGTLLLFSCRA